MVEVVPRKQKRKAARPGTHRWPPTKARLDELITEATMDAYGEAEQRTGLYTMLEEHLALPLVTEVLGVAVTVERIASMLKLMVFDIPSPEIAIVPEYGLNLVFIFLGTLPPKTIVFCSPTFKLNEVVGVPPIVKFIPKSSNPDWDIVKLVRFWVAFETVKLVEKPSVGLLSAIVIELVLIVRSAALTPNANSATKNIPTINIFFILCTPNIF